MGKRLSAIVLRFLSFFYIIEYLKDKNTNVRLDINFSDSIFSGINLTLGFGNSSVCDNANRWKHHCWVEFDIDLCYKYRYVVSVRIKCRDLVKKIAIYRHRLAVSFVSLA